MARVIRLKLNNFRNLKSIELFLSPGINLFVGANGSGKTSLLEALHVLGTGRSFRTTRFDPLIANESDHFMIFAEVAETLGSAVKIGLKRNKKAGPPLLRLNEHSQNSWSQVAASLPLQLINSDSFCILEGGGKVRRRFLDWALFHVEQSYLSDWRDYRRVVSHRNTLLKQKRFSLGTELDAWDAEMAVLGETIHQHRLRLIGVFEPEFKSVIEKFLPRVQIDFEYRSGWVDSDTSRLGEVLKLTRDRDIRYGMSLSGPHRGDFSLKTEGRLATDTLSRGQTKMLIFALKLAMGNIIKNLKQPSSKQLVNRPIYMIDDLAAELDEENSLKIINYLAESGDQCIFTAISELALKRVSELSEASGKFHVEHGKITSSPAMV